MSVKFRSLGYQTSRTERTVYKLKEARIIYEINGVVFNTKPQHSSLCADTQKKI